MDIKPGKCYGQRNPLWGRGVIKVNRQVRSSVLDFERYDVTAVYTTAGIELVEHNIQPATIYTETGYEEVSEELFLKLRAMARMTAASAKAMLKGCDLDTPAPTTSPIAGVMACRTQQGCSVVRVLEADPLLPSYKVERLTADTGLVYETRQLSVKQLTLDGYRHIPDTVWSNLYALWQKTASAVELLLTAHHMMTGETDGTQLAEDYARGMQRLLGGVYDVVDVHK